jgi:Histidine kinase-, DNA gyrase B-, and HSP90-like ATPase
VRFQKFYYYLSFVFYFICAFLYVSNNYLNSKNSLLAEIDSNLTRGALSVPVILPEGFHNIGMAKDDVALSEDMENIKKLNAQAKLSSLQYIYSCIKDGDKILFSSSSATDEELRKNENISHYFDLYDDAKAGLKNSFTTQKIIFDEYTDKWGHFRSVFIPQKSTDGKIFVVCADVKIDFVKGELDRVLKESILELFFYIAILIPLFAAYHYHNKTINEELESKVRERTRQVKTLLDNASQGFLSFSSDMLVHDEYSTKCTEIFECEIGGKNITHLLFAMDEKAGESFTQNINSLIGDDDTLRVENILSLLCNEFTIGKKAISVEYKIVSYDSFMIILTDITEKKQLEKNLEKEKNRLKMVVSAVTNPSEFFELLDQYKEFIKWRLELVDTDKTALHNISELYRTIHTFKGLFTQKEFITTPQGLHKLETRFSKFLADSKTTNDDIIAVLKKVELENWLERDMSVLVQVLGDEFFDKKDKIIISTQAIDTLCSKIRLRAGQARIEEDVIDKIVTEVERLKQISLFQMLSSYPKLIEQLAQRLDKRIYPVQILCDENIFIGDEYKPFIRSLVHVFRNSIDHGIESPEMRVLAGKEEFGTLSCMVSDMEDVLQIIIADDGVGIDIKKVTRKAIASGIYTQEQLETMSQDDIGLIIFCDNFSTKDDVSDISGRGVGLAAVKSELENAGGWMKVSTTSGAGATMTFFLPYSNKKANA